MLIKGRMVVREEDGRRRKRRMVEVEHMPRLATEKGRTRGLL